MNSSPDIGGDGLHLNMEVPMTETVVSQSELLPCPFCGGAARDNGAPLGVRGNISCLECGTVGPMVATGKPEAAVAAWNTRAIDPRHAATARQQALRAAAEYIGAQAKSAQDTYDLISVQSSLPISEPVFSCGGLLQMAAAIRSLPAQGNEA